MPGLYNPISKTAQLAIGSAQRNLLQAGKETGTGLRTPTRDAVGFILGSNLHTNAVTLGAVSNGISYGINFLNAVSATLTAAKNNLTSQLEIILQSPNAGATALAQLADRLTGSVAATTTMLDNAAFDGRAYTAGAPYTMPVRLGVNAADTVNISIATVNGGAVYPAAYDIVTDAASRTAAETAVKTAIDLVQGILTNVTGQIVNLQSALESAQQNQQVNAETSNFYLGTDYEETIDEFAESLNKTTAARSIMGKSFDLARTLVQLIQAA